MGAGAHSRSLGCAPPDFLWSLVALRDIMRLSLRERRTRGFVQCCVAGNPGRDDKGKADRSIKSGCWTEAFFITLGGPKAHYSSGRDDKVATKVGDDSPWEMGDFLATTLSSRPE